MKGLVLLTALAAAFSIASAVGAEEVGREEYAKACAGCHGSDAEGLGPIARTLNIDAPDLRELAMRNGGVFPFKKSLMTIDGRQNVRLHGSTMPIWGERYSSSASLSESEVNPEIIARGRLLSLVYYLESIQKQ